MLPPDDVTPLLSNALRYSSATDLRCSSVMVSRVRVIALPHPGGSLIRGQREDEQRIARSGPQLRRQTVQSAGCQGTTGTHGDELPAARRVGDGISRHRGAEVDLPQHLARLLIEGAKPAVGVAAE